MRFIISLVAGLVILQSNIAHAEILDNLVAKGCPTCTPTEKDNLKQVCKASAVMANRYGFMAKEEDIEGCGTLIFGGPGILTQFHGFTVSARDKPVRWFFMAIPNSAQPPIGTCVYMPQNTVKQNVTFDGC